MPSYLRPFPPNEKAARQFELDRRNALVMAERQGFGALVGETSISRDTVRLLFEAGDFLDVTMRDGAHRHNLNNFNS